MIEKKVMYSVLKVIQEPDKKREDIPMAVTYDISHDQFRGILKMMLDEKLFESPIPLTMHGRSKTNAKKVILKARLTMKGLNYLEENSGMAKTWKGIKEIQSWIPFIGGGNS